MGRKFFLLLLLLELLFPVSVFAATSEIQVTASVVPSPEWTNLVKANSQITHSNLTLLPFTLYTIKLSDGNILLKHDSILLSYSCSPSDTLISQTDNSGQATFLTPTFSPCFPEFTYLIGNLAIPLNSTFRPLTSLSQ